MAKAKDTAKEAPKARTSKAKEKAAEKALLAGALTEAPAPLDAEARKTRLKNLIKLGKEWNTLFAEKTRLMRGSSA